MNNNHFEDRQQYIRVGNDLRKGADVRSFIKGNEKKEELDKRLEEISLQSGTIVSGRIVRQNIMDASASTNNASANPNVVDTLVGEQAREQSREEQEKEENPVYSSPSYEKFIGHALNKGKMIIEDIKNNDPKNIKRDTFK